MSAPTKSMRVDLAWDEPVLESATINCSRCYEPVYFADGLRGPERWKHVATDSHICAPSCKHCQQPATNKIFEYGRFSHWECNACAAGVMRIERT
jgi:hypothetical protein